jgi:hypothetical protein
MFRKFYYLIPLILTVCLVQNASGVAWDITWTGAGHDTMWNNPANWAWMLDPSGGSGVNEVVLAPTSNGSVSTIAATDVFEINDSVDGPAWGMTLNSYGSLNVGSYLSMLGGSITAPSTINMFGNSSLDVVDMLFGDNWWFTAAPYVALNMYGNSQATCSYFWWGGKVKLYDNSILTVTTNLIDHIEGLVSDSTKQMDFLGGTLVLLSGNSANITNYIGRGILLVYGKTYDTNEVIITDNGTNTVVTVPPLGALQSIFLTSARTNMMVGTFQALGGILANFANVQDVPLTMLDAAQLGGNTVSYISSDPSVVGVTTNGHVTAVKPGSATVSATLGSVTSINSVLITVTPYTNSLIHRYSFSETGGSTTADSVGGADGLLDSGATLSGGWVTLDPSQNGAIQLPAGIVTNMDAVTVEAWVSNGAPQGWATLFAFGDQDDNGLGMNYIAFQPFTGVATNPTAAALFGTGDPGNSDSQDAVLALTVAGLSGTTITYTTNTLGNVHIVCVYHPYAGYVSIYTNGVLAAINSNVSNPLAATLNANADPLNLIGESLYDTDPFWSGAINEFRIYNGPLTAGQILADYALGPNQLIGTNKIVSLSAKVSGDPAVVLSWPTNSALVAVMSSSTLGSGASWSAVTGYPLVIVGTNYQMTIPAAAVSGQRYFRLQQY